MAKSVKRMAVMVTTKLKGVFFGYVPEGTDLTCYGSGDGYGYGSGSGSGSGSYWSDVAKSIAGDEIISRLPQGSLVAFWKSRKDGTPANGGSGDAVKTGDIQEVSGPLEICTKRALHATLNIRKLEGERLWVVALYPPVEGDDEKYGSLKREIICEVKND